MTKPTLLKPFMLALAAALLASGCQPASAPAPIQGVDITQSAIGGPFTLIDAQGRAVDSRQFDGRYRIVYFGYTFCPDVCPVDVAALMQGFARFEKAHPSAAAKVQPLFVSVDPGRDTPARVGEFAAAFSPRLIGLTGTQAQIDAAVKAYKAYAAKGAQSAGGYLMDHTRLAYLMGPKGEPLALLPVDKGPDAVASDLALLVK